MCSWLCRSAEKHPPRGVFAAPDGPKRTRKRPAQALAALEALRQQRGLTVQRSGGSDTDAASDSLPSGSGLDRDEDADSSDPESLAVVQPVQVRRLQIPDSEDQEQAQVPVLATDMPAHAAKAEAGPPSKQAQSAGVAHEQEAFPPQPSQAVDQQDNLDSPGGSNDSDHRRTSPSVTAGARARSGRVQLHECGEAHSSEHKAVSEDPAMKRMRMGSSMRSDSNGDIGTPAQLPHVMPQKDALVEGPVAQELTAEQHNSAVSTAVQGPPQTDGRTARVRRSELERLMPFSWDKWVFLHSLYLCALMNELGIIFSH